MAKKYFQAKKQKNPLAKKHPHSKKNRLTTFALVGVVVFVIVFWLIGLVGGFDEKSSEVKPEKKEVKVKEFHPKRVVKPIADDEFKGAKEYNFYTQLEERSLVLDGEEKFGGIALENVNEPPKLSLESLSQKSQESPVKTVVKQDNIVMPPLVLESGQQATSMKKAASGSLILQVGSFGSNQDAQRHQALLAKYGFSAKILHSKNNAQKDIYRVRIGGFSQQEIGAVKKRLDTLGISYFEVK